MRKILMSKPGEFVSENRQKFTRGVAVKMLADLIRHPHDKGREEETVVVAAEFPKDWKKSFEK